MKGVRPQGSGVVVGGVLPVFEVCRGVGGGGRPPGAGGPVLVHREDVEERRGAEVVHVDHAGVPDTEVLVLTQHITALVLTLENIAVQGPVWLVIDGLLVNVKLEVRVLVMILGDPPPGVDCAVDQRTQSEPDIWSGGRNILALAFASQDSWKCEYLFLEGKFSWFINNPSLERSGLNQIINLFASASENYSPECLEKILCLFFRNMKKIVNKSSRTDMLRIPIVMPIYIWEESPFAIGITELGSSVSFSPRLSSISSSSFSFPSSFFLLLFFLSTSTESSVVWLTCSVGCSSNVFSM